MMVGQLLVRGCTNYLLPSWNVFSEVSPDGTKLRAEGPMRLWSFAFN